MRKGVLEGVLQHIITDIKPNYEAPAKQYHGDYRTVKRYCRNFLRRNSPKGNDSNGNHPMAFRSS